MPTYAFHCPKSHRWEAFLSILDLREQTCPQCRAVGTREIGAGIGIMMKNRGPVSEKLAGKFKTGETKSKLEGEEENVDARIRDLGHEVP